MLAVSVSRLCVHVCCVCCVLCVLCAVCLSAVCCLLLAVCCLLHTSRVWIAAVGASIAQSLTHGAVQTSPQGSRPLPAEEVAAEEVAVAVLMVAAVVTVSAASASWCCHLCFSFVLVGNGILLLRVRAPVARRGLTAPQASPASLRCHNLPSPSRDRPFRA